MKKIYLLLAALILLFHVSVLAENMPEFITDDNSISVSADVGGDGWIKEGDRVNIIILKPGYEFSDSGAHNGICYMAARSGLKTGENIAFSYSFPNDRDFGKYSVKLSDTDAYGTEKHIEYTFYTVSKEQCDECVDVFKKADAEDFADKANYFYNTVPVLKKYNITELENETVINGLGKSFESGREIFSEGLIQSGKTIFTTPSDVADTIKAALLIQAADNGAEDSFASLYSKYGSTISSFFFKDTNVKKFFKVYGKLENTAARKPAENIKLACILSYIQDGTERETAETMEKYADVLKIDKDYLSRNGVSYAELAKYIDTGDACIYENGMQSAVKDAVESILNARKKESPHNVSSSGGGGASGGASFDSSFADVPSVPDKNAEEQRKERFTDLDEADWAEAHINNLAAKNVLNGVGGGRFEPNRSITREEFVKLAVICFEIEQAENPEVNFIDCNPDDWYYPYVKIALSRDIVRGADKNLFGAGMNITRQDMAVILSRIMEYKKKIIKADTEKTFEDNGEIDNYAEEAVYRLVSAGIISGFPDNTFRPHAYATRAEAAVMIDMLSNYFTK